MNEQDRKSSGLSGEYKKFNKLLRHLRRLHKDTFQAIVNVIETEQLSEDQVRSVSATSEEVTELHQRLHAPLTVIIAGQDNYGKVAVLTKLLGTQLLPFTGSQHNCCCAARYTNNKPDDLHHKTNPLPASSTNDGREKYVQAGRSRKTSTSCLTSSNVTADGFLKCVSCGCTVPPGNYNELGNTYSLPHNDYEKPWRGIRISYSASQITYSVVRPDSLASTTCPCQQETNDTRQQHPNSDCDEDKDAGQHHDDDCEATSVCALKQESCKSMKSLNASEVNTLGNVHEDMRDRMASKPVSIFHSLNTNKAVDSSTIPVTDQSIATNSVPATRTSNDMTLEQLEDLLEEKFQSHVQDLQKARVVEEVVADDQKCEIIVKEVPISELELGSQHLKDPILRDALLDVGLNHCLLREHLQIIMTPSVDIYDTNTGALEAKVISVKHQENVIEDALLPSNRMAGDVFEMEITTSATEPTSLSSNITPRSFNPISGRTSNNTNFTTTSIRPISVPISSNLPIEGSINIPPASDPISIARSPSLLFGTPICSSAMDQSPSSLDSFKSLPVEYSPIQDLFEPGHIPKTFHKITRSVSYSPSKSTYNVSGILFSNIPHGGGETTRRRPTSVASFGSSTKTSKIRSSKGPKILYNDCTGNIVAANDNSGYHSPDFSLSTSPAFSSRHNLNHTSMAEMADQISVEQSCRSMDDLQDIDDHPVFSSSDLPMNLNRSGMTSRDVGVDDGGGASNVGFMATLLPNVTPFVIYAITRDTFTKQEIRELTTLRQHVPPCPVVFLLVPPFLQHLHQPDLLCDIGVLSPVPHASFPSPDATFSHGCSSLEKQSPDTPSSSDPIHRSLKPKDGERTDEVVDHQDITLEPNTTAREDEEDQMSPAGKEPMVFVMDNTPKTDRAKRKIVKFMKTPNSYVKQLSVENKEMEVKKEKELIVSGNCNDEYTSDDVACIRQKTRQLYIEAREKRRTNLSATTSDQFSYESKLNEESSNDTASKCKVSEDILSGNSKNDTSSTYTVYEAKASEISSNYTPSTHKVCQDKLSDNSSNGTNSTRKVSFNISREAPSETDHIWPRVAENIMHVLRDQLGFLGVGESLSSHVSHSHLEDVEQSHLDHARNPFINSYYRRSAASKECNSTKHICNTSVIVEDSSYTKDVDDKLNKDREESQCTELCTCSILLNSFTEFNAIRNYTKKILRGHIAYTSQLLSKVQSRCLSSFVVFAFELSRQLQITPRRLQYARGQEEALYRALLAASRQREEHIRQLIARTLDQDKQQLMERADRVLILDESSSGAVMELQERVLRDVNSRVGEQLVSGVQGLRESCLGTLRRCLQQLEEDCNNEQPSVTHALKKLVNAAYEVEVRPTSSFGLLRGLWERVRSLVGGGGPTAPPGTEGWRRKVAQDMIDGLSERRLARTIAAQVSGEIKSAHSLFLCHLELLEFELQRNMANSEQQQQQLRAVHAPRLARLALHTDALMHRVTHGLPELSGELGRGHFGVVYACKGWSRYSPCAVKTLLPRDSTQWRDIAMQYHYTRLMGHHERVVSIHACLVDKYYGEWGLQGGHREAGSRSSSQCVLLIMDVHKCDLDAAIRRGLRGSHRIRIALDVVQGIRFLHSQGLIHRDIKPKNILIDNDGRAKVTDLDFCKPEAMMTGSVVGTPIHMAPELFTGTYDSSVDVYAFGVLFWYLCSGKTNMPKNFCLQKSKEDLKNAVFKGVRPECLSNFSPACWSVMEHCWAPEPRDRMLLGTVEDRLTAMLMESGQEEESSCYQDAEAILANTDSDNDYLCLASEESDVDDEQQ